MTWYEWVVGGFQFVTAWWCTNRLTHGKSVLPDSTGRQRRKALRAAHRVEIQRHSAKQACRSCGIWIPTSGSVAHVNRMCRRCHSHAIERGVPPALDFTRYEPPGIYGAIGSWKSTVSDWQTSIAEQTVKLEKEWVEFEKERDSYYARNPRRMRGLTSEPPAM